MAIDFGKRFGLGTLRLPLKDPSDQKPIDYDQFCEMVDKFLDHGFRYFDTSYIYHDNTSEIARSWQVPRVRRLPPRHAGRLPRPHSRQDRRQGHRRDEHRTVRLHATRARRRAPRFAGPLRITTRLTGNASGIRSARKRGAGNQDRRPSVLAEHTPYRPCSSQ